MPVFFFRIVVFSVHLSSSSHSLILVLVILVKWIVRIKKTNSRTYRSVIYSHIWQYTIWWQLAWCHKITMQLLMTVDTNTFPVYVYFTFFHVLIINVALNNIVRIKILKCYVAIHVSKFCASSQHNDIASLEKNKFRFPRSNITSPSFDAISIHHSHTWSIL